MVEANSKYVLPITEHFPASPEHVGILMTYSCTAACANCCFECSPKRNESLSRDRALKAVEELSTIPTVKGITFSGGESFLRYDDMRTIIECARKKGLRTKCVTNAYWATNYNSAIKKLYPLAEAGLNVLEVSTDEYHINYVPLERVTNALKAGQQLGIETHLIVIYDRGTRRLEDIKGKLNLSFEPSICREFPLLPVGAAKRHVDPNRLITQQELPPRACMDIGRRPSITPRGEVFACCAVAGFTSPLRLGSLDDRSLTEIFALVRADPLFIALALDGPAKIAQKAVELGIFSVTQCFVDECHLCHALLSQEQIIQSLRDEFKKNIICYLLRRDYAETILDGGTGAANGDNTGATLSNTTDLMK